MTGRMDGRDDHHWIDVWKQMLPPPNYTYRVKPPPTHTTQGRGPDGQTPRILYTTTSGCCFTLATSFSPFSMLHFPTLESHASEGMACAYMCVCVRVCMYNIIHGEVRTL
jgi:hypothetical protein